MILGATPLPVTGPWHTRYYELRLFEAQRLGVAAWVTETGSDQQLLLADQYMLTWMHWDYKWYRWVHQHAVGFHAQRDGQCGARVLLFCSSFSFCR